MVGLILGTGYVDGLGLCYIEQGDHPDFLRLTHTRTGHKYYRQRTQVSWRPAKYKH